MIRKLRKLVFANNKQDSEEEGFDIVDGEVITSDTPLSKNASDKTLPPKADLESEKKESEVLQNKKGVKEKEALSSAPEKETKIQATRGRPKKIEGFFWHLQASGRSPRTIQEYKKDLRFWKGIATANRKTIYTLTIDDIEKAILSKRSSRKKRLIAMLKSLGKFYLRYGHNNLYIECQKIISIKKEETIPKHKDKQEFIQIREHAKKLCNAGNRQGVWLGLMLMCGLRISEIQTATIGKNFVQVTGKGNKQRQVPCPAWLIDVMSKMQSLKRGGYAKRREVIDPSLRKLGYKKFHSLRHTYATMLLHEGYSINEIQKLLGHSSIVSTEIYSKTKMPTGVVETLDKL